MLRLHSRLPKRVCVKWSRRMMMHSAFTITPRHRCQEQEQQACYLTKTLIKYQLPSHSSTIVDMSSDERNAIHQAVKQCIISTNYFHRDGEPDLPKRWRAARKERATELWRSTLANQLLLNMLRVVWSSTCAQNLPQHSFTYETDLVAPWERLGEKIQVTGRLGHLISGKQLMRLFADEEEIMTTCDTDISWDDVISPFFDMHQQDRSYFVPNSGFHADTPFPCPQTLLVKCPVHWETRYSTGQGIFYCFAHALNFALSRGESMGGDLLNPVPMQCIVFTGTTFHFVCYQLNTLDFSEDNGGKKNIAWVSADNKLYTSVVKRATNNDTSTTADDDYEEYSSKRVSLVQFDRSVLTNTFINEKVVDVLVNGYDRSVVDVFVDFLLRPSV